MEKKFVETAWTATSWGSPFPVRLLRMSTMKAMLEKTVLRLCQSRKFGGETVLWGLGCCELDSQTITRLAGSWYGSGRRRTELMTEKIAVFAPMPRASVRTATA